MDQFDVAASRLFETIGTFFESAATYPDLATFVREVAPQPTTDDLAHLLRESFYATLLTEEGRTVRVVCSFLRRVLPGTATAYLSLDQPLRLDRYALRSLAPAAPTNRAVLQVAPEGGSGPLHIYGILNFNRAYGRPIALTVGAHGPGRISVSFNNERILSIAGDRLTWNVDHMGYTRGTALMNLGEAYKTGPGGLRRSATVASLLIGAASVIRRGGHGGALWVLPDGGTPVPTIRIRRIGDSGDLFEPLPRLEASPEIDRAAIARDVQDDARAAAAFSLLGEEEAYSISSTLANLANVDGAVLLNSTPALLGFGAFIETAPPSRVLLFTGREFDEVAIERFHGGRHRSAAAFCHAHPESSALVVSQDGEVKLLRRQRDGSNVLCFEIGPVGSGFADSEF